MDTAQNIPQLLLLGLVPPSPSHCATVPLHLGTSVALGRLRCPPGGQRDETAHRTPITLHQTLPCPAFAISAPPQAPCACRWHRTGVPRSPPSPQRPRPPAPRSIPISRAHLKAPGTARQPSRAATKSIQASMKIRGRFCARGGQDKGHSVTGAPFLFAFLFWSRGLFEVPAGESRSPSGGETAALRKALVMDAVRWGWGLLRERWWEGCGRGGVGDLRSV